MPLSIAYLDDEELLGELFLEFFEDSGYEVAVFATHEPFIAHCEERRPNLVFIDFHLNGTRGDVVAKALDPAIPKILMTGELSVDADYEFDAILSKPCRLAELTAAVEQYASR